MCIYVNFRCRCYYYSSNAERRLAQGTCIQTHTCTRMHTTRQVCALPCRATAARWRRPAQSTHACTPTPTPTLSHTHGHACTLPCRATAARQRRPAQLPHWPARGVCAAGARCARPRQGAPPPLPPAKVLVCRDHAKHVPSLAGTLLLL